MLALEYTHYSEKALLEQYCDRALFVSLTYNQYIHAVQGSCSFVLIADVVDTVQLLGYNLSEMSALHYSVCIPEYDVDKVSCVITTSIG